MNPFLKIWRQARRLSYDGSRSNNRSASKPYGCLLKFSAMATASRMDMDLLTVS
jgi:hypothetical protein